MPVSEVTNTIDHLFRHEYGSIVSGLVARFGSDKIEWIEDAVQESLYRAMKLWGFNSIPDKPDAWLYRVAYRSLIDRLRKEQRHRDMSWDNPSIFEEAAEVRDSRAIQDEQLRMLFACCTPEISEKNSLLLSLKLIGGFSTREIARSMLIGEEAARKSLRRARKDFQAKVKSVRLPEGRSLTLYLSRVLKVIYLIFTEGYKASDGDLLLKEDLCGEALRLSLLLSQKDHCQSMELLSLISLICFKAARFEARIDGDGYLVLLEDQDRSLYNREYVNWGYYYFHEAGRFQEVTPYFLEAAIEYQYHIADSYSEIQWEKVLETHQRLQQLRPSSRGRLNYLIVYSKLHSADDTLKQLSTLNDQLEGDHVYHTFKGDLLQKKGLVLEAAESFQKAIELVQNRVERQYILKRIGQS